MFHRYLLLIPCCLLLVTCTDRAPKGSTPPNPETIRIAFGSCAHEDDPQPMLDVAIAQQPDLFLYLGDNIYGDTENMDTLRAKYARLAARPEFQRLRAAVPIQAVWDDHDYGWNDAGRHYPFQEESKQVFLDFWRVPKGNARYDHPGIYGVEYLEKAGKRIQILLLDTRTFRDDLILRAKEDTLLHKNDYVPNDNPDSTFLGATQWSWLEEQLRQPADARIVASSNQFGHSYNGWESWTNVPHERQRFLDLIKSTKASRVFFLSGDVHWGEISRLETPGLYPIYDVTSSGITSTWYNIEPNDNRVGKAIAQNNIGVVEFSFGQEPGTDSARLLLIDSTAVPIVQQKVELEDLTVPDL